MALKYYQLDAAQVLAQLHTQKTGLSQTEAATRLQATGPNKLSDHKQTSLLTKFILQFKDLMIIILMIAAFVALLAGEGSDAIIIFLVIILNAVFGGKCDCRPPKDDHPQVTGAQRPNRAGH